MAMTPPVMGRPSKVFLAALTERAEEAEAEVVALRAERIVYGRAIRALGGRIVHVLRNDDLLSAHTYAGEVIRLAERLEIGGSPDAA